MFFTVLSSIIVLYICILTGFICQKKKIITDEGAPVLSGILVNVTLPSLMIASMQRDFDIQMLKNSIVVLVVTFLSYMAGLGLGYILCKLLKASDKEKGIWMFVLTFPNIVYMGLPVIEAIYGADVLFYVYMSNVVFNILVFTLGAKLINYGNRDFGGFNLRAILANVPVIATVLGIIFFVFSIRLPYEVNAALTMLGDMTVPLSMIVIGSILAKNDLKTVFTGWKMYVVIFARLVFMPLLVFVVMGFFIEDKLIIGIMVILTGMPPASLTAILAAQYGRGVYLASKFVFAATVISIITIPLLALLI